ncbi:hypothetical protein HY523_02980 [Candidatus Berkelbacteria bacterium]|nr:hypothetical protein [Candidatus Berkelbacteria bacterium]
MAQSRDKFFAGCAVGIGGWLLVTALIAFVVLRPGDIPKIEQFGQPTPIATSPEGSVDNLTPLATAAEQATFRLEMTDSGTTSPPPADVMGLTWTIKKIELGLADLGTERPLVSRALTDHWESLPLVQSSVDLFSLRGSGGAADLVDTRVVIGRYHTLRLTLERVQARHPDGSLTNVDLAPESQVLESTAPLVLEATTGPVTLTLDLDSRASLVSNPATDTLQFHPVIRGWNQS